jgi:hypothetical protein
MDDKYGDLPSTFKIIFDTLYRDDYIAKITDENKGYIKKINHIYDTLKEYGIGGECCKCGELALNKHHRYRTCNKCEKIYHEDCIKDDDIINICSWCNEECDHICVAPFSDGFTCGCPDGYIQYCHLHISNENTYRYCKDYQFCCEDDHLPPDCEYCQLLTISLCKTCR